MRISRRLNIQIVVEKVVGIVPPLDLSEPAQIDAIGRNRRGVSFFI